MKNGKKWCCFFLCILFLLPVSIEAQEKKTKEVYATDVAVFIDMEPIVSYRIEDTIYIAAQDLQDYSFDVKWEENSKSLYVIKNLNAVGGMLPKEKINIKKEDIELDKKLFIVSETDAFVFIDNTKVESWEGEGKLFIPVEALGCTSFVEKKINERTEEKRIGAYYVDVRKDELEKILRTKQTQEFLLQDYRNNILNPGFKPTIETQKISYSGQAQDGIRLPHGIGKEKKQEKDRCSYSNWEDIGYFEKGEKNGLFFEKGSFAKFDCSNDLFSSYYEYYTSYQNDKYNGYCLFKKGYGHDALRIQGEYKNGEEDGWIRESDMYCQEYLYDYCVRWEGYYVEGEKVEEGYQERKELEKQQQEEEEQKEKQKEKIQISYDDSVVAVLREEIEYEMDFNTVPSDFKLVNSDLEGTYYITKDGKMYYLVQDPENKTNLALFNYMEDCKKRIGNLKLTMSGKLYQYRLDNHTWILLASDVKDMSENYYLKNDGTLYTMNREKIMDSVKQISGENSMVILKEDGSVWFMRIANLNADYIWKDRESLSEPVFIMNDCRYVNSGKDAFFAIKNDNTLWGWGYNFGNVLRNGKSMAAIEKMESIPGYELENVDEKNVTSYNPRLINEISIRVVDRPIMLLENVKEVQGGRYYAVALLMNGQAVFWGNNRYYNRNTVIPFMEEVEKISCTDLIVGIIKKDGTLWSMVLSDVQQSDGIPEELMPKQITKFYMEK